MNKNKGFIGYLEKSKQNFSYILEETPYYDSSVETELENIINNMEITYGNIRDSLSVSINVNVPYDTVKIPEKFQYNYIEENYKKMIENNITFDNTRKEEIYFYNHRTQTKETYQNLTERVILKNNLIREIKGKLDREPDLDIYSGNYTKNIYDLNSNLSFDNELKETLELYRLFENSNNEYMINIENKLYEKYLSNLESQVSEINDLFGVDYLFARSQIRFILNKGTSKDKENLKKYIEDLKWEIQYYFKHIKKENQILIDIQLNKELKKSNIEDCISNKEMIDNILKENPNSEIFIRIPKKGIKDNKLIGLDLSTLPIEVNIIEKEEMNSFKLLKQMDLVYTKTSYLGFEALLIGCEVVCYGVPFYAGWGITTDLADIDSYIFRRHRKNVSLLDLFTAVFLIHNKYINPYKGINKFFDKKIYKENSYMLLVDNIEEIEQKTKKTNIVLRNNKTLKIYKIEEETSLKSILDTIIKYKSYLKRKDRVFIVDGKETNLKKFIKNTDSELFFIEKKEINLNDLYKNDFFIFNGSLSEYGDIALEIKHLGCNNIVYVQEKTNKINKDIKSIVIDTKNHYQNYLYHSELEDKINTRIITNVLEERNSSNQVLEDYILIKKSKEKIEYQTQKPTILVIGQKEGSKSLKYAGLGLSNMDLIKKVKEDYPNYYLIYKSHPKSKEVLDKSFIDKYIDLIETNDIYTIINSVDEIATISSFVGLEAMVLNKRITTICYGLPFYACWGITIDKSSLEQQKPVCERREKGLFSLSYGLYGMEEENTYVNVKLILEVFLFDYQLYIDKNNDYYDLEYFLRLNND